MLQVPIHEAKAKLSSLIAMVEKGQEVVLTRHGKRVVRIAPEAAQDDLAQRRIKAEALMASMRAAHADMPPVIPGYNDLETILALNKSQQR